MTELRTINVVDDDESVRRALERLFRSVDLEVEVFSSGEEFLEHEPRDGLGCLVLDVQMPGPDGLELQTELVTRGTDLPIVFLTGHGDIPMTVEAMKGGAVDFLPKPVDRDVLLGAVEAGLELHERLRGQTANLSQFRSRVESLTKREREVMALVVAGRLNKQIARDLGIALDTVKVHRGRVMRKTRVESLAELVRLVERAGLT